VLAAAAFGAASAVQARTDIQVGIGFPAPPVFVQPRPVYGPPAVVYERPSYRPDFERERGWRHAEWQRREWERREWERREWQRRQWERRHDDRSSWHGHGRD
jgi:hypothetical protein